MALYTLWASEVEREPSTISAAIDHSLQAFVHARAKTIQAQAVQATLQGRDVFVSVPTGYGKSLIFQIDLTSWLFYRGGLLIQFISKSVISILT